MYGPLAYLYGRKRGFFAGTSVFLVGSALCGFSWNMGAQYVYVVAALVALVSLALASALPSKLSPTRPQTRR